MIWKPHRHQCEQQASEGERVHRRPWKRKLIAQFKNNVRNLLMKLNHKLVSSNPCSKRMIKHVWDRNHQATTNQLCLAVYDDNVINLQRSIPVSNALSYDHISKTNFCCEMQPWSTWSQQQCPFICNLFICFAKLLLQSPGQYWHLIVLSIMHIWTYSF